VSSPSLGSVDSCTGFVVEPLSPDPATRFHAKRP
jgi:hypothetical protein